MSTTAPVALGVSDSGHQWQDLSSAAGATGILGNRALLRTAPSSTLAVLDAGTGGGNGRLSANLIGMGGGLALYFRVVGPDDWWRAYQRIFTYQYQTGTETYVSGYEQVYAGEETYIAGYTKVEYRYRYDYAGTVSSGLLHGHVSYSAWSTSSTNPGAVSSYSHSHDGVTHTMSLTSQTQEKRGGDPIYATRSVYQSQPVYSTRPTYATTTGYELRVELSVATSRALWFRQITGPFPNLSVVMKDGRVDAYGGNGGSVTAIDETHKGATRHGIGIGKPSESLDETVNFMDDFLFAPELTGGYQPPVLL